MPYGYNGKILCVNLTDGSTRMEEKPESWYRKYLGGRGIGAYYLLKDLPAGTDALAPENILVFAVSVVTGVPFPGNARASVVAKSPLTGGFGEAEAGGNWGPELKFAGFDAVVITGKSEKPVYLYLRDGQVEIRDAGNLWGLNTSETEKRIFDDTGDPRVKVACIGPGGENLVRYACITAGRHNVFGRLGLGAVMGSKNLKAVAVSGGKRPETKEPEKIKEISRWVAQNFNRPDTCGLFYEYGTSGGVAMYNAIGSLPSYNFQGGTIEGAEKLTGEYMKEQGLMIGKTRCFACPIACRKIARVENSGELDTKSEVHSPEYETIAALGSNCGITDPKVVIKAAEMCDEYGLDTISTGVTISFVMECAQKGILPKDLQGDMPVEFGSAETILRCIEMITYRRGIGDIMAEGTKRMAARIGNGAEALAVHGKGEELALQDPRGGKVGAAIGYAVAHNGGDHIQMEHDFQFSQKGPFLKSFEPLGVIEPVPTMDLGIDKVRLFVLNQIVWGLYNMLDICIFVPAPGHVLPLTGLCDLVKCATGWDTSLYELMKAGERGIVMTRIFNLREGFGVQDDVIPRRLTEPLTTGESKGSRVEPEQIQQAVKNYYEIMGWDHETGAPSPGKLKELGLDWLI
ncbi:Aldehyde ferredoxin oxidoreductase [Thermincola ferriacetica]|uniref:Aldehyde ferredoxin oxidoreductase n=2 Tax=Thermincola TaxID=278993 RepID=D5X9X4_THEPJ|nr:MULTISPECIES: aldehyde ferredoxin oxidoreductase family protein [Thermincola]ADG83107.1 Aldehyde ferredoxin oxidoreductase [Thermincola potens JR]KNZ70595.1 Aldehyde ferredoxin oxidoreductase [Thermincola ferriacetica]